MKLYGTLKRSIFGNDVKLDRKRSFHEVRVAFGYKGHEIYSAYYEVNPEFDKRWLKEQEISLDTISVDCSKQQLYKATLKYGNRSG